MLVSVQTAPHERPMMIVQLTITPCERILMRTHIEAKPRFTDLHRFPARYRPSFDTDIRETFERAREVMKAQAKPRDARWPMLAAI